MTHYQQIKAIADKHIAAKMSKSFPPEYPVKDAQELIARLLDGHLSERVLQEIETRCVSITSQLMANPEVFGHVSEAYKKAVYKGFKLILYNNLKNK